MDYYNINRLIKGNVDLGKDIQCKKEIKIMEDSIYNSTLDIWCKKEVQHPKLIQYEVYKCFIMKYEFAYSGLFNPDVNLYHYTLKDIAYTDKIDNFWGDSADADKFFASCLIVDKYGSSGLIKNIIYENGEWYFKGKK